MRLRTDSAHLAGWRRARMLGALPPLDRPFPEESATPPAEIGDAWVARRAGDNAVIGYCLTCPREACAQGIHCWTHGMDCQQRDDPAHLSCWTWTGSAEDGTLTANPSLWVIAVHNGVATGGCGFHGWLRNGVLAE